MTGVFPLTLVVTPVRKISDSTLDSVTGFCGLKNCAFSDDKNIRSRRHLVCVFVTGVSLHCRSAVGLVRESNSLLGMLGILPTRLSGLDFDDCFTEELPEAVPDTRGGVPEPPRPPPLGGLR